MTRSCRSLAPTGFVALLAVAFPNTVLAQRDVHWARIDVAAHLGAAGDLHVTETQTMVFTGAWNGGERRFRIRPGQKLSFEGLYRGTAAGWTRLTEDSRLDDADEYAWSDARTLRWRSRRPDDPPFDNTAIRYELRYVMTGILQHDGDDYRLDHDFAFPDREGPIVRFTLRFTHDGAWQPLSEVRTAYTAGPLPPGRGFVLTVPLHHAGGAVPFTADLTRPPGIRAGAAAILGFVALAIAWFFIREQSSGRFVPVMNAVDEAWLAQHVLNHPAEVVGAAWDASIGQAEVVALLSRMVTEGKLETEVSDEPGGPSMKLRLKVDRRTLEGYEGTLVSWLFFDGRNETSTEAVRNNYREQGFNPAAEITPELQARVQRLLPSEGAPRTFRVESVMLFLAGAGSVSLAWLIGQTVPSSVLLLMIGVLVLAGIGCVAGVLFRARMESGRTGALVHLVPALTIAAGSAAFLWFYAGNGAVELSNEIIVGIVGMTLGLVNASVNALRTRQSRAAIAVRKELAAAREFFVKELRNPRPALRDEWYPYLLAFGLARAADDWSAQREQQRSTERERQGPDDFTPSSAAPAPWSGFAGGRSGGAGASGSWSVAANVVAAGVPAPRASGSEDGSSSDSGGSISSSSSSSSSGGGGGGGW